MAASRHWITGALLSAALALALSACSSTPKPTARSPDDGRGSYKVGKPYNIDGKTYYPAEDWDYSETGIASWYGPGFHGRSTASGETYDQEQISAAHKTLPMPSIVRVTNLDNGKSVVARVNDRGPFVTGRIIDMSKGGARELGLDLTGVARVKVEIMRRESEVVKSIALSGGTRADQMAALNSGASPPPVLDSSPVNGPGSGPVVASTPPVSAPGSSPPVVSASQPIWSPGDPPPRVPMVISNDAPPPPTSSSQVTAAPLAPPPVAAPPAQLAPPPVVTPPPPVVTAPPLPPTAAAPAAIGGGQIYVQAGAFSQLDNAEKVRVQLSQYGRASVSPVQANGRELYRVRLGPMASAQAADAVRAQVLQAGYRDARVISD